MEANFKVFVLLLMAFIVSIAEEDCEPIRDWYDAISKCLDEMDPDDRCFRRCLYDTRGYKENGQITEAKMGEALQGWNNQSLATIILSVETACLNKVQSITDQCKQALELNKCTTKNPEVKNIIETKVCVNELTKYIVPSAA